MAAMKFSVGGSGGLNWQGHVDAAAVLEECGYYGFYPSDHLMPVVDRGGDQDRLDAPSTLLALSGRTSRIRLGCMVQANLLRHPVITAMSHATLDHASTGRDEKCHRHRTRTVRRSRHDCGETVPRRRIPHFIRIGPSGHRATHSQGTDKRGSG